MSVPQPTRIERPAGWLVSKPDILTIKNKPLQEVLLKQVDIYETETNSLLDTAPNHSRNTYKFATLGAVGFAIGTALAFLHID